MTHLSEATTANFDTDILQAKGRVLVDFWAPWCGPCKMQTPILERIAAAGDIKTRIFKLNTDENPALAQKYGIVSIPTLILFEDGKEVERFIGVQPENVLKSKLV